MAEINGAQIVEQINDLGAKITEVRQTAELALGKNKDAEARIADELTQKFVTKQELEQEERARKESLESLAQVCDGLNSHLARMGKDGAHSDVLDKQRKHMRSYIKAMSSRDGVMPNAVSEYMQSDEYRHIAGGTETRALNETTASDGGFLVPEDIQNEIIKPALNLSPVRELARVVTTTSNRYVYYKQTSGNTAYWVGEQGAGTASQAVYAQGAIDIHDLLVRIPITEDLLMDARPNMEMEMAEEAGKAFQLEEGQSFVSGTGVGEPWGFETRHNAAAAGANYIITGGNAGADLVEADDFYKLLYGKGEDTGLQKKYRDRAIFGFNSNTLRKVLILQDGGGNYLWNSFAGLQQGEPATIAGRPFRILEDMDDDGTNANNPVVCADWDSYYRIVDRVGVSVLRDPYSGYPVTTIYWRKRLGADVTNLEAGRLLVV